jgi:ABC-type nitrate/sulfonate/bicarbonate transport system substrate-binding protein
MGRRRLTAVLLLGLFVAACSGAGPTSAPGPAEVRVAYQPGPAALPVQLAARNGIFERNGLRVDLTEGNDATVFTTAVAQRRYEIVMSVPSIVLVAAEKGLEVQVVTGLQRSSSANPNLAWITKNPAISALEQLKGRTVAVPSLVGQVTDSFVYLLGRRGVDRKDVRFVQLGTAAMVDQLNAGNVDAAVYGMNLGRQTLARNGIVAHSDVVAQSVQEASGGSVDEAITLLFAAAPGYVAEHPEVIRGFRRSLTEAMDHLRTHDAEARALLQDWLKTSPAAAAAAVLPNWRVELEPAELGPYVTIARATGTITRDPDLAALVWTDRK